MHFFHYFQLRLNSYVSEDSVICRESNQYNKFNYSFRKSLNKKRRLKYVTSNDGDNVYVLNNTSLNDNLLKFLYTKFVQNYQRKFMSSASNLDDKQSKRISRKFQIRTEYYNDFEDCLKDYKDTNKSELKQKNYEAVNSTVLNNPTCEKVCTELLFLNLPINIYYLLN